MTSDLLSWLRRFRGLTLKEVAEAVGVSHQHIWRLETGQRYITPAIERRIMAALDLDYEKLMRLRQMYAEIQSIAL